MYKMSFLRAACTTFLLILAMPQISRAIIPCVPKKSQWGYTLENSAYDSSPAENYPTCLLRCLTDTSRCRRLSYDLAAQIRELSVESRWSKPGSFKQKEDSIYMEMLGVIEILTNTTQPPVTQAITEPPFSQGTTQPPVTQDATPAPATSEATGTTSLTLTICGIGGAVNVAAYCSGKTDGDYSRPNDCRATCKSSFTIIQFCSGGKKFNPVSKECEPEENVVCP